MRLLRYLVFSFLFIFSVYSYDFDGSFQKVKTAEKYLKKKIHSSPKLLIVLTAGIEGPVDEMEDVVVINSKDIPYFPIAKAKGHEGKLIFGTLDGHDIVLMKGRYHFYEGIAAQEVVFPYFVLNALGVENVITMNAVGGIRYDLNAGDIMLVTDHINYLFDNALRGLAVQFPEKQFTDMTEAYCIDFQDIAENIANKQKLDLKKGIYIATMGPNYETKAEIKMFRKFGADAVGMSTIFESLACNFLNMRVLAFCCIANPAADRHAGNMNHEEVLAALKATGPKLSKLTTACAKKILKDK